MREGPRLDGKMSLEISKHRKELFWKKKKKEKRKKKRKRKKKN